MASGRTVARGLVSFSLSLGLLQVPPPNRFSTWIGVPPRSDRRAGVRAVGARELGAAAGLLAQPRPVWMWSRVAGDAMDLALLARAARSGDTRRDRVGGAIAGVAAITAVDVLGTVLVTREAAKNGSGSRSGEEAGRLTGDKSARLVTAAVTVNRPREEVYAFWRDFTRLPQFMLHLEEVRELDAEGRRSHWKANAPGGATVEWDAELIEDRPNERISWRSLEGADVTNAGTVRFEDAPGGRGTRVHVDLEYSAPGGAFGTIVARLAGEEPRQQTWDDLRRFKQVLEIGEIVRSEGTIGERRIRQRPAQPVGDDA